MEGFVDHYIVLGLPLALKLTEEDIKKAYKAKLLIVHPDKRRDDPHAHEKFHRLRTSYEVLIEKARKLAEAALLRVQRQKSQVVDSKRRKMMSDLEERELNKASTPIDEEENISKKLKEEVERIRRKYAQRRGRSETPQSGGVDEVDTTSGGREDKERVLKVSWDTIGEMYTAERLRQVFSEFGEVEDVVIRRRRSAFIVMSTKDGAVAATRQSQLCGDLSNPLLVVPLYKASQTPDSNIVGAGFQASEDEVMQRLKEAARNQEESVRP